MSNIVKTVLAGLGAAVPVAIALYFIMRRNSLQTPKRNKHP